MSIKHVGEDYIITAGPVQIVCNGVGALLTFLGFSVFLVFVLLSAIF